MIRQSNHLERNAKIRKLFSEGLTRKQLAYCFNLSYAYIQKLIAHNEDNKFDSTNLFPVRFQITVDGKVKTLRGKY